MKKTIKSFKNEFLMAFRLSLLIGLLVGLFTGCTPRPTEFQDPTDTGKAYCIQTKVLSETPSPDGELKAVVYQYNDPCARFYMENLSIQPNNEKTLSYVEALNFAVYGGEGLRPQWRANREMVVMGDSISDNNKSFISMKQRFGYNYREDIKAGQSFSYPVGWFDSMKITLEPEKYEVKNQILREIPRPDSKNEYNKKAVIYRYECKLQSSGEIIKYVGVSLNSYEPENTTYPKPEQTFSATNCEQKGYRSDLIYKIPEGNIDAKWTSSKELIITSTTPNGENGLIQKNIPGITVKYEQAK